jgi:hypothetical protein
VTVIHEASCVLFTCASSSRCSPICSPVPSEPGPHTQEVSSGPAWLPREAPLDQSSPGCQQVASCHDCPGERLSHQLWGVGEQPLVTFLPVARGMCSPCRTRAPGKVGVQVQEVLCSRGFFTLDPRTWALTIASCALALWSFLC